MNLGTCPCRRLLFTLSTLRHPRTAPYEGDAWKMPVIGERGILYGRAPQFNVVPPTEIKVPPAILHSASPSTL